MACNLALEHEMGYRFKKVAANSGSVKICMNAIRLRISVKSFFHSEHDKLEVFA